MHITAEYAARLGALYRYAHTQPGIKPSDNMEKTIGAIFGWTDTSSVYEPKLNLFTTELLKLNTERGSRYYKKNDLTPTYRALLQLFINLMQYKAEIGNGRPLNSRHTIAIEKMTEIVTQMLNGRVIETLDGKNFQEDETLSGDSILTATNAVLIEAKKAEAALLGVEPLQENESPPRMQGGRANSGPARKAFDPTSLHILQYPVGSVEDKMRTKIIALSDQIGTRGLSANNKITPEVVKAFDTLLKTDADVIKNKYLGYKRHCNNLKSNVLNDFIKLADDLLEDSKPSKLQLQPKVTDARLQALQKKYESRFNVDVALRTAITAVIGAILVAAIAAAAILAPHLTIGGVAVLSGTIASGHVAAMSGIAGVSVVASMATFFTGKDKKELYKNQRTSGFGKAGQDIIITIEAQNSAKI